MRAQDLWIAERGASCLNPVSLFRNPLLLFRASSSLLGCAWLLPQLLLDACGGEIVATRPALRESSQSLSLSHRAVRVRCSQVVYPHLAVPPCGDTRSLHILFTCSPLRVHASQPYYAGVPEECVVREAQDAKPSTLSQALNSQSEHKRRRHVIWT
ncbi:hypothetical protein BJ546DRAFT_232740 [Cryomyces antarcticus]